jgi:hypothetical protein
MTQEERDKITAFVASMGFERSGDMRATAEHIEQVIKAHRTAAAKRERKSGGVGTGRMEKGANAMRN